MDDNYKKYIKYKNKYNKIVGGSKIFDLDKKSEYTKGELHENIEKVYKKYGENIKIKYKDLILDVELKKIKLLNNQEIYQMMYDIKKRTYDLTPFIIEFIDPITMEKNNTTYISNIHRTEKISGSEMVKICLRINEVLGAEKTILGDGTKVVCEVNKEEMDLSYLKLLERKKTFYMNLGFDYEITKDRFFHVRIEDKEEFRKKINETIDNIRRIKTEEIIEEYEKTMELLVKMIKENYKEKIEMKKSVWNPIYKDIYIENPESKIIEIIEESKKVLDVLNKYREIEYLYEIMIKIFKKKCDEYVVITKYIVENMRTKIKYGKEKIERKYVKDFSLLVDLRYIWYSYIFV